MSPSWCTGDRPWRTHRVTTGCSVWLGPKQLRAPRPRSPVRPMGFLGWTSLLSLLPTTGRASPRGLRGARGLRVTVGSVGKERGALGSQSLCPRDRVTDASCHTAHVRGRGGRRGRGQHPAASHGCGHRRGSVVRWTLPGGSEPGTQTGPCCPHPGHQHGHPRFRRAGPAPCPISPHHVLSKTARPGGGGPGGLSTKMGGKAHHPCRARLAV